MRACTHNLSRLALVLGVTLWGAAAHAKPSAAQVKPPAAQVRQPADLAGAWDLALDKAGTRCRVLLRPERSDKGDYFLGLPAACRHAMPGLAMVGRWALPDDGHIAFQNPAGKAILTFAAAADGGFTARSADGSYALKPVGEIGRSAAALQSTGEIETAAAAFKAVVPAPGPALAIVQPVAKRAQPDAAPVRETAADLAGRYAVMREKRDTGCMLTLDDKSRAKGGGGDRAQLAPGCRDQGIVIFDPAGWALVKGELVLTARAGHKTKLEHKGEGSWAKDTSDGGKPIGLKKL